MTTVHSATGFGQPAFDVFLHERREPDFLSRLRHEAWNAFLRLPLPARDHEEWRRTDIRALRLDAFGPPLGEAPPVDDRPALLTRNVDCGGRMVVHNGRIVRSDLAPSLSHRGVVFGPMHELAERHADVIRRHLGRAVRPSVDKFAALTEAFYSAGSLLIVPRGVAVREPLHLQLVLADGGADLTRLLVVVEEGAECTFLMETSGDDAVGLHAGIAEIFVGPAARLQIVTLQDWGHKVWHFAHKTAVIERDGILQWTIGALGSRLSKVNQHVVLAGPGAQAQVNGVMFTEGRQHLSYHTLQHHEAPFCKSNLLYKAALQDQSRIVWRGMIKVDPDARRTDGYQRNDCLILTEDARADSIPGLEIKHDDVRCTHGATVGRVDDEQIFYLQSRGLTRKEAVRTVVAGFFQQVFDRIQIESVREALGQAVGRKIREYD
jgi:Fe-S cluster assembly protein SufD